MAYPVRTGPLHDATVVDVGHEAQIHFQIPIHLRPVPHVVIGRCVERARCVAVFESMGVEYRARVQDERL